MLSIEKETHVETRSQAAKRRIKHVSKFGAVGVLNTIIDFAIFNLLSSMFGLSLVKSNIASTTVAMMFSFFVNKQMVFKKHDGTLIKQMVIFFAVTTFGLYILQTGAIVFLTDIWLWPLHAALSLAHALGIKGHDEFLIKNGAKAIATLLSLSWNYVMYKKVVFK